MVEVTDEDVLCRGVPTHPQCWEPETGLPRLSRFQRRRVSAKRVKPEVYEDGISVDIVRLLPGGVAHVDTDERIYYCLSVGQVRELGLYVVHDPVAADSEQGRKSGANPAHALILSNRHPRNTEDAEGLRNLASRCTRPDGD